MLVSGLSIPTIVIFIHSTTFSIRTPGFPDALESGFESNVFHVLSGGVVMLFVFSLLTLATPYVFGVLLSQLFATSKTFNFYSANKNGY